MSTVKKTKSVAEIPYLNYTITLNTNDKFEVQLADKTYGFARLREAKLTIDEYKRLYSLIGCEVIGFSSQDNSIIQTVITALKMPRSKDFSFSRVHFGVYGSESLDALKTIGPFYPVNAEILEIVSQLKMYHELRNKAAANWSRVNKQLKGKRIDVRRS